MAACGVGVWLRRHSHVHGNRQGYYLPSFPSSPGPHGGVGWRSAGPELQLEGLGDVEKATDGWLEAQGTRWARVPQREGLQDGGEQEEELGPSQALPEADTLT